jgi:hypothetical protein
VRPARRAAADFLGSFACSLVVAALRHDRRVGGTLDLLNQEELDNFAPVIPHERHQFGDDATGEAMDETPGTRMDACAGDILEGGVDGGLDEGFFDFAHGGER